MIKPVSLEIEGFRSFKEKAVIKFPDSGSILISGKYRDSAISSGSGKSSILMAMAFALGFCDLPSTELKNWESKSLYVYLKLSDGENHYEIVRNPKLTFTVNGLAKYDGTTAEDMLRKLFNAPIELVKTLTYRAQKEPGAFIGKSDSDKKEMLSTLLGLNALEVAHDKVANELKTLESSMLQSNAQLDTLMPQIKNLRVDQEKVNEIHGAYQQAQQRLAEMQGIDTSAIQNQISQVRSEIARGNTASREMAVASSEIPRTDQNIEASLAQIRTIQEGTCPTCKQGWSSGIHMITQLEDQVLSLRNKKVQLETVIKNGAILEQSIKGWQVKESQLLQQLAESTAPMKDVAASAAAAKSAFDQITYQVNNYNSAVQSYTTIKTKVASLEQDITVSKHAESLLSRNGFLGVIFDEVLLEIESIANQIIGNIPNVCTYTVSIESTSVTKSGNLKKSISVTLNKDGKEASVKTLSGGQRCAIDLAVDMSISEAIRRRSGTRLGWIALDEAMDGLDLETKRAALEAIKHRVDGILIVVDHASEIKEAFEQVIEIEYDGRHSKIL